MSSNAGTPSSLLTLTGQVEDLLLSYVASGDGGLQSLLNLRRVCSTTKEWVDSLQPVQGKRIFRKCGVAVKVNEEELQRFVEAPAPSHATSLRLIHMDHLSGLNNKANWTSFVSLWSPKLESLEMDTLSFPLDAGVLKLLSSSSLRRLYCHWIEKENHIDDFPDVLFQLEEVCVDLLEMKRSQKKTFFRRMSTNANLKRFYFDVDMDERETRLAKILVDAKKDDPGFQLTLRYSEVQFDSSCLRLARSIVESSSKIRIAGVDDLHLKWLGERAEEDFPNFASTFFPKVVWILYLESSEPQEPEDEDESFLEIVQFPNLRRLDHFEGDDNVLDEVEFPPKLEHLAVYRHFFEPARFPTTLTHLTLRKLRVTADELVNFGTSLAGRCPRLHFLEVRWTCESPREEQPADRLRAEPNNSTFSNLRSLTFVGTFSPEESPLTLKRCLLDGFKLNQLSLLKLELSACDKRGTPLPLLDSETLSSIVEGSVSKTAICVEIEELSVKEDARGLLQTFEGIAAENSKKQVETHGRRAPRTNFWFD